MAGWVAVVLVEVGALEVGALVEEVVREEVAWVVEVV